MTIIAILLALGAAVAWSLEAVLAKPGLRHMDMFSYAAIRPLFALLFVVPFGLWTSGFQFPGWRLVAIAVVAGVIDSFVGSMLFYFSVERVPAHEASALANTAPFWGVVASVFILGERLQPVLFVAAFFVVLGAFFLVNRREDESALRLSWNALPALGAGILWGVVETVPAKYCLTNGMSVGTFQLILIVSSGIAWGAAALIRSRRTPLRFPRRGVMIAFVTAFLGYALAWTPLALRGQTGTCELALARTWVDDPIHVPVQRDPIARASLPQIGTRSAIGPVWNPSRFDPWFRVITGSARGGEPVRYKD